MPQFIRIHSPGWPYQPSPGCYLKDDNWDDFTFKTLFDLMIVGPDGTIYKPGTVKIIKRGMTGGRVDFPEEFEILDDSYCSLGQEQNYYEQIAALPNGLDRDVLSALRDCAADDRIWRAFRAEPALTESLLRFVSSSNVEGTFRDIVQGRVPSTAFAFEFEVASPKEPLPPLRITVEVMPHALPPTNVHVLIGRNGVGKTRLLAGLANALTGSTDPDSFGLKGEIRFPGENLESGRFANLVTVAFSAFDRFAPIASSRISGNIRYGYVGLKREGSPELEDADATFTVFKNLEELTNEFAASLAYCSDGPRRRRWADTVSILNGDPGFAELELDQVDLGDRDSMAEAVEAFGRLSSGHKIVLLTTTRLVELVDERTLVLIDEPESHLHPPLLGSFVRALSSLLVLRNGVAVVATHSPVVLQEVPRSCVSVMRRTGAMLTAERPKIETFGENVGILTHEVFQLEVTESGFHRLLLQAAEAQSYDELIASFDGQLGAEGRAIARVLTMPDNDANS